MAEEGGPASPPIGIDLLLLRQLHPAAIHQPDQREVQVLGHVGDPKNVVRLSGNPRSGHYFVVKPDNHRPFPADFAQPVHHPGGSGLLLHRVIEGVQGHQVPGSTKYSSLW